MKTLSLKRFEPSKVAGLLAGLVAGVTLSASLAGCADTAAEPAGGEANAQETQERELVAHSDNDKPSKNDSDESGFDLAELYEHAESERARKYIAGCQEGRAESCYELGDMLHGGDDIVRDNDLSVALIDHACRKGFLRACYDMGVRFHLGVEVEQDLHASRAYFQHTCAQGVAHGCHMLARVARNGIGVPVDLDLAARYADRSCTLGYSPDCELSFQRDVQPGVHEWALPAAASDEVEEAARVCDAGLMQGCVELARAYERGEGVSQSVEQAYMLYASACDWGHFEACEVYREME